MIYLSQIDWMRGNTFRILRVAAVLAGVLLVAVSPAWADDPELSVPTVDLAAALHCPESFEHPEHEPVLLVHGTTSTFEESWAWNYAEALTAAGYDVCGVDLPEYAWGDIQISAEYVVYALQYMNSETNLSVDAIGHSQGPLEIRWAVKWWPSLLDIVDDVVLLATPNDGLAAGDLVCAGLPCAPAGIQLGTGSSFMAALNAGDKTPGSISFTSIYSAFDGVVPTASADLDGATNILVQNVCLLRPVTHLGMVYDAIPYLLAVDALSHSGTASPSRLPALACLQTNVPGVTALEATTQSALIATSFALRTLQAPLVSSEPELMPYAD